MLLDVRRAVALIGFLAAGAWSSAALPQTFPSRPVLLVTGAPPGSPTDTLARTLSSGVLSIWGQPTIVSNKPGAGGLTAASAFRSEAPGGHAILIIGWTAPNPEILATVRGDLAPVTLIARHSPTNTSIGAWVPRGTPDFIIQKIGADLMKALASAQRADGFAPIGSTPADLERYLAGSAQESPSPAPQAGRSAAPGSPVASNVQPQTSAGTAKGAPLSVEDEAAAAFESGDFFKAANLFERVVKAKPRNILAWHFLGQSRARIGDPEGARRAYQQVLQIQPSGPVADRTRELMRR